MSKKKPQPLKIARTFSVQYTFNRAGLEGILIAILDDLAGLTSRNKTIGAGMKHPLVVAVQTLSRKYDLYNTDLLEELKATDEQLMALGALIPDVVPNEFMARLENWDTGEDDDFYWETFPTVQERKAFVDAFSNIFLPPVQAVLKKQEDERAAEEAADKKREEERKARFEADKQARIRDAEALLRGAGYEVKKLPAQVVKMPAKKKAPR